jgi:hypothetical protein
MEQNELEIERQIIDEQELKCGDCNKLLLTVNAYSDNDPTKRRPNRIRYIVDKCYNCGGKSFYSKWFNAYTILEPPGDKILIDFHDQDYDGNEMTVYVHTRRKK